MYTNGNKVKCITAGDLAQSAAILFYGRSYTKVANIAELVHLPILTCSESSFHRLQKEYLYPVHTAYV